MCVFVFQGKTLRWHPALTQNKCWQVMKENVTWTTSLTTQQWDVGAADHTHTTCGTVVGGRKGTDYPGPQLKHLLLPSNLYLKIVWMGWFFFVALKMYCCQNTKDCEQLKLTRAEMSLLDRILRRGQERIHVICSWSENECVDFKLWIIRHTNACHVSVFLCCLFVCLQVQLGKTTATIFMNFARRM